MLIIRKPRVDSAVLQVRPGVAGNAQATQDRAVQESCRLAGFKKVQLVKGFDIRVSNKVIKQWSGIFCGKVIKYVFIYVSYQLPRTGFGHYCLQARQ